MKVTLLSGGFIIVEVVISPEVQGRKRVGIGRSDVITYGINKKQGGEIVYPGFLVLTLSLKSLHIV